MLTNNWELDVCARAWWHCLVNIRLKEGRVVIFTTPLETKTWDTGNLARASAKGSGYWAAVQALSLTRRAWRRKKQVRHSSFDQDTSLTVYAVDGRGASWLQWRPVEPWMKNVHSVFNKGARHNLCSHYFSLSIQVYLAYSWCLLGLMLSPQPLL